MSRTSELIESGASVRGTDGREGEEFAPFLRWLDEPTWIEGIVVDFWEGKYEGGNATILVTNKEDDIESKISSLESGEIKIGQKMNIGLSPATLRDKITKEDIVDEALLEGLELGDMDSFVHFHVAFSGWTESTRPGGNRYRQFVVPSWIPADNKKVKKAIKKKEIKKSSSGPPSYPHPKKTTPDKETTPDPSIDDELPF